MRASAAVEAHEVRKSFGAQPVLRDISLRAEPGEFLVLLGPSGCGKSTLLNAIAGLEEIEGGRIEIGGRDVTRLEPAARDIAMVFQSYALYPTMTVRGNITFGARMRGTPRAETDAGLARIARLLQIEGLLDRRPGQLSGGQRQRVAIGRALMRDPAVFLFDEPLSNLDAKLRAEMRGEVKLLHQRLGTTMLYVTHDQVEAMTMGTRIAVLSEGTVRQVAAPAEIYARPADLFVAGFVGSPAMNLLPARIVPANGEPHAAIGSLALPLGCYPFARQVREGDEVVLGLRPEAVSEPGAGATITAALPVSLVEPLGADTLVRLVVDGGSSLTGRFRPGIAAEPGQLLTVGIDLSGLSVFGASDGARL